MRVAISSATLAELLAAAAASPRQEICGLLFGREGRIDAIRAVPNVAVDPCRTFELDPSSHFAALRAARQGGPAIVGHYHSHPTGNVAPSVIDAAMIGRVGELWLIIAGGQAAAWRSTAARAFAPVTLAVEVLAPAGRVRQGSA